MTVSAGATVAPSGCASPAGADRSARASGARARGRCARCAAGVDDRSGRTRRASSEFLIARCSLAPVQPKQDPVDRIFALSKDYARSGTVAMDLTFVVDACERLLGTDPKGEPVVAEALWIAAAITYARCFDKTRLRLALEKEAVKRHGANRNDIHGFVLRVRDEYIAHVQARLESQEIFVEVETDPATQAPLRATGVAAFTRKLHVPSYDAVQALRDLAVALLGEQNEQLKAIRDEVLALAKTLSPDQLAAMQRREVAEPKLSLEKR